MKRSTITEIIAALLILLWVYAAVSKLTTFNTFRIQLSKSPMLTGFADIVAILAPLFELIIAGALALPRWRLAGLYASLFLLLFFTAYLIAILNFSYYIPCSCGGILGNLSWQAHIVFNLGYALSAAAGIVLHTRQQRKLMLPTAQGA